MYERTEYNEDNYEDRDYKCKRQTHVHEYLGSTRIAEREEDPHNHRFAGVTGEAEQRGNSHVHRLRGNSDFYENHFHTVAATTGPAIPVGGGRHVHFVSGTTSCNDGHMHNFIFATLIENPIG
ncbi:YmaF family protein [Clostridium subterminale]|uniref:YmaF family protein n=1 Tax=Clostridium subterminale TaxID=1550 RepID=A0ABP3W5T3_CLOSU